MALVGSSRSELLHIALSQAEREGGGAEILENTRTKKISEGKRAAHPPKRDGMGRVIETVRGNQLS